jgi:type I restriction enzyme R subunit
MTPKNDNHRLNQDPEDIARDKIDEKLRKSGWIIQAKNTLNLSAGIGIAVTELVYDTGEADYTLFIDRKPVGVIEAKRAEEGLRLTSVEEQALKYAKGKIKKLDNQPLYLVYETNGEIIKFTDYRDPKPRSREIFSFQQPETLRDLLFQDDTLRSRFNYLTEIPAFTRSSSPQNSAQQNFAQQNFRKCQIDSINGVEKLLKQNKDRILIHMATGSGKTYTAISCVYRLLKHVNAKRVLFLVDTKNLGKQAEQEFNTYLVQDDNRKFVELYNVHRLQSNYIPTDAHVCISTIQRLYAMLQGKDFIEDGEEENPNENQALWQKKEPLPVAYNSKIPPEFFDFIIIDECHRSIYNLWRQVLEYFDAFLIGLTATPDSRTYGFFKQNIANQYSYQESVIDGVNVGYNTFIIDTEITSAGGKIPCNEYVEKRDKLTRARRFTLNDEDYIYNSKQLDREVVSESQIRTVIRSFKENLFTKIFTGRTRVPKTLIFAKTDSHADDIIRIVREEFDQGNSFCKKITYKAEEDPDTVLSQFRNEYNPRIAVTVDMVATGTDIKPLECLMFMRNVKSQNYFEQMKGRGVRTLSLDDLKKVTQDAKYIKDHFVIIDAVGVTKTIQYEEPQPKDYKPTIPLKDLLQSVALGCVDEDLFNTLATRFIKLEKRLPDKDNQSIEKKFGCSLTEISRKLISVYDEDLLNDRACLEYKIDRDKFDKLSDQQIAEIRNKLITETTVYFTADNNNFIENIRRNLEQTIDTVNIDKPRYVGWSQDNIEKQQQLIKEFEDYVQENRDKITALNIFYNEPYRRKEITYKMITDLDELIRSNRPKLALTQVYRAYLDLEKSKSKIPEHKLVCLVSLIRRSIGIDSKLTDYGFVVDKKFADWIFKQQQGHKHLTEQQVDWLRMMKDHIKTSFHIEKEDFDYAPFDNKGGLGMMYKVFGEQTNEIIDKFNENMGIAA